MTAGYQRLDPYIIETHQGGLDYRFIVYHFESKAWFDNQVVDAALKFTAEENLVKPNDVVFDLGCNSGFLTSWFGKQVGPQGKVLAFDPFPWNTAATYYTGKINGLHNIEPHTVGISNKKSVLRIPICDSKTYENQHVAYHDTFEAQLLPLDHFASSRPNFIKVDIEGAERDLLAGARLIAQQQPEPIWFLEIHNQFIREAGCDPDQIAVDFEAAGYRCRIGHPRRGQPFRRDQSLPNGCGLFAMPSHATQAAKSRAA